MGYHKKLHNKLHYYIALCILSISPVLAEEGGGGDTNNSSNPVAAATGNVTNSAVQFQNNGASSRQSYGPSIQCNGSTMTFSPFIWEAMSILILLMKRQKTYTLLVIS